MISANMSGMKAKQQNDARSRGEVTCCDRCNKSRGTRPVKAFCSAVAQYLNHGALALEIELHVRDCIARDLAKRIAEAKTLIARRGSVARVLAGEGK